MGTSSWTLSSLLLLHLTYGSTEGEPVLGSWNPLLIQHLCPVSLLNAATSFSQVMHAGVVCTMVSLPCLCVARLPCARPACVRTPWPGHYPPTPPMAPCQVGTAGVAALHLLHRPMCHCRSPCPLSAAVQSVSGPPWCLSGTRTMSKFQHPPLNRSLVLLCCENHPTGSKLSMGHEIP